MEFVLQKKADYLVPVRIIDKDKLEGLRDGYTMHCKVSKARNPDFHRKYFALLNHLYDSWEPPEGDFRGIPAKKNFERFRKDIQIQAGYYDVVVNLKGEVRAESKSIAFNNMDETEFEQLYDAVAEVGLKMILTNYTKADLEGVVTELMKFTE